MGSASPRRVEILKEMGMSFRQIPSGVEEHNNDNGQPFEMAKHLAEEKSLALMSKLSSDEIVITADTVVELAGRSLGKPSDNFEASQMLRKLSGNKHTVCTALALADQNEILASGYELTKVIFNAVPISRIEEYVESGEPMDKAGAYGIQGMGGFLVDRIEGSLDNVVGLPSRLLEHLAGVVLVKLDQEKKETKHK